MPAHTVLVVRDRSGRKVFAARGSAFSAVNLGQAELLVLASVVDSALMKLFAALGIYFAAPDLERRWGPGRLVRFMITAGAVAYLRFKKYI